MHSRQVHNPSFAFSENVAVWCGLGCTAHLRSLLLSFAPCTPVPRYTVPWHANAAICSGTEISQGVTCPALRAFLWPGVEAGEVCSCVAFFFFLKPGSGQWGGWEHLKQGIKNQQSGAQQKSAFRLVAEASVSLNHAPKDAVHFAGEEQQHVPCVWLLLLTVFFLL